MKILILHYYLSIVDGVMTSLIDLYQNLRMFRNDITFNIICPELYLLDQQYPDNNIYYNIPLAETKLFRYDNKETTDCEPLSIDNPTAKYGITPEIPFLRNNRCFGDLGLYSCLTEDKEFEADTIICSARLLYEIYAGKPISINCKRLIVMDSLDLTKSKLGIFSDLCHILKFDYNVFLVNPCNHVPTTCKQYTYYQKFNIKRFEFMPWLHDTFTYRRTERRNSKIADGRHLENMGRVIFEHLYKNKIVNYYTDGMFMRDGLYYYLRLFGIDGEINHIPLDIESEEVKEELFMSENDLLLDIL